MLRTLSLLVLLGCTEPKQRFVMPRNVEDLRARLIQQIPVGRDMAGARQWMEQHGFTCAAPMASAADAHVQLCTPGGDAGSSHWTVALIEREGRLADVQAR